MLAHCTSILTKITICCKHIIHLTIMKYLPSYNYFNICDLFYHLTFFNMGSFFFFVFFFSFFLYTKKHNNKQHNLHRYPHLSFLVWLLQSSRKMRLAVEREGRHKWQESSKKGDNHVM